MPKNTLGRHGLPHEIFVHKSGLREAQKWCEGRLGERWSVIDNRSGRWACFWCGTRSDKPEYYVFCFESSEDAVLCALRWS